MDPYCVPSTVKSVPFSGLSHVATFCWVKLSAGPKDPILTIATILGMLKNKEKQHVFERCHFILTPSLKDLLCSCKSKLIFAEWVEGGWLTIYPEFMRYKTPCSTLFMENPLMILWTESYSWNATIFVFMWKNLYCIEQFATFIIREISIFSSDATISGMAL